jgi:dienelactone hydrolase
MRVNRSRKYVVCSLLAIAFVVLLTIISVRFFKEDNAHSYFLNPTGQYGVGYKKIIVINTMQCPDKLYVKGKNENDFSDGNKRYCHEILLNIYYPATNASGLGDSIYQPVWRNDVNYFLKHYKLTTTQQAAVRSILEQKTHAHKNAIPVDKGRFPIILFLPGAGQPAQTYMNIISNLVSNGYVVIGMNSLFLNGPLRLANGHVVVGTTNYAHRDIIGRSGNLNDLKFLLNHLRQLHYSYDLKSIMNFKRVGLIGHSRNGMTIVNLLKQQQWRKPYLKSAVILDPGDLLGRANYPLPKSVIPTLLLWSSRFKHYMHGFAHKNKMLQQIVLTDAQHNIFYTNHEDFSDISTMQYHPGYQLPQVQKLLHNHHYFLVGSANGYKIAEEINKYIVNFCDRWLKQK